jgi:hypothetical protein
VNPTDGCFNTPTGPSIAVYTMLDKAQQAIKRKTELENKISNPAILPGKKKPRGRGGRKKTLLRSELLRDMSLNIYTTLSKSWIKHPTEEQRAQKMVVVPGIHSEDAGFTLGGARFITRRYFLVPYDYVKRHLFHCPFDQFDELLIGEYYSDSFLLVECVYDSPLRFVICSDEEYIQIQSKESVSHYRNGQIDFCCEHSSASNMTTTGIVVSMWSKWSCEEVLHNDDGQAPSFDMEDCIHLEKAFKGGFGNRRCANNTGMNLYFGPRRSERPRCSPDSGPGEDHSGRSYYSETFNISAHTVPLMNKIRNAATKTTSYAATIAPNYLAMTGIHTCDRLIWTQGTIGPTGTGPKCISFSNFPHVDSMDKASEAHQQMWLAEIAKIMGTTESDSYKKIKQMKDRFGLGLPTTCGYNYVGSTGETNEVVASFGVMGFAVPLTHKRVHHFYGWAFLHFTCLSYLMNYEEKIIRLFNSNSEDEEPFVIAAWGDSGGNSQVAAARRTASVRETVDRTTTFPTT